MGRGRRAGQKVRRAQTTQEQSAARASSAGRSSGRSARELLERIRLVRAAQEEAEAELGLLVDDAVALGIGWPEIATELGVTRQAASQNYLQRHDS